MRAKEEEIRRLLKESEQARQAFEKMLSYYRIYDLIHYTTHIRLINSIYLNYKPRYSWQLANIANIARTTCFLYRRQYIECFYLCLF